MRCVFISVFILTFSGVLPAALADEIPSSVIHEMSKPSVGERLMAPEVPQDCGHQELVGKSRSDAQSAPSLKGLVVRIMHEGDQTTMDYSPARVNIILDEHDIVIRVYCG
ncbi:MAG: I78 family peptidase inhibitor [Pseudobdellovibrionaceae bacterium]